MRPDFGQANPVETDAPFSHSGVRSKIRTARTSTSDAGLLLQEGPGARLRDGDGVTELFFYLPCVNSRVRTRLGNILKATEMVEIIPLASIVPSRFPLRTQLGNVSSLAASIRKSGMLEPIIVRPLDTKFEIVAGHRRFEACRRNRYHEIHAIVKELSDKEAYTIALEENLQRETLDPLEEGVAFRRYVEKYGYGGVTELARCIGRSEEYVSHRILLLSLHAEVQDQVRRRLLGPSDAWEISRVKDPVIQKQMAQTAIVHAATVRQIREVANLVNAGSGLRDAFTAVASKRGRDEARESPPSRDERLKSAAALALRVALIRIDALIEKLGSDTPGRKDLMNLRLSIHDLIGEYQGRSSNKGSPSEEIASLVKDRFLVYFNSGKINEIARMRSGDTFTIFDDYPLPLMDLKQSLKHDLAISRSVLPKGCEVEDLRIHLFGSGIGAVATFLFHQRHVKNGRSYSWKSRVSFVFERVNKEWRIVHEHWSEAVPALSTITRIKDINKVGDETPATVRFKR